MGSTVDRLRSRLLVGVAAMALAVPMTGKAYAQAAPDKWSPYVEAGGMVGTRSFGDVDIFLPLWQDQGSLLFGDLRGVFTAQPTEEGNFGLGYRTQISPDWILGGYGYFDIANSANNNLFYQVTLGVELKSIDWDFRLNGYIPINPDGGTVSNNNNASIHINGNSIQMQTESRNEKALYGFDGEVGWRVPVFPADGDMDLRVYAGGYYFTNSDVDTIAGPRGRIEARLYDIDFLGLQSRLTAQGVVQWDQPRGVQGFGGLELRIPLGAITGSPGPKLNPLDRRMVDRVQRDVDIVTEKTTPDKQNEDVIVDELTVSTHTIVFANGGGSGTGAQGSPIDLNKVNTVNKAGDTVNTNPGTLNTLALNGGTGSNAIILVDGGAGNVNVTNPFNLLQGQALIGGGSVVPLTGVKSGKTVDFAFDGTTPTLVGAGKGGENLVELAANQLPHLKNDSLYQNEIFGVIMDGGQGNGFENGVHGVNMYRAIVKNSSITSAFANGIFLENVSDGAIPPSSFVHIEGNVISDNGENGIFITTDIGPNDLTAHTQTIVIDSNEINSNGVVQGLRIAPLSGNGIYISNFVAGVGSVLSQNVVIDDNVISHNGEVGILVSNVALEDGVVSQSLTIDPNTIEFNSSDGIFISDVASDAGSLVSQSAFIAGNTITGHPYDGISVHNQVGSGGTLSQALTIAANTVASAGNIGIDVYSRVSGIGALLSQSLSIESNRVVGIGADGYLGAVGIHVGTTLYDGATATQNLTIAHNLVSGVIAFDSAAGIAVNNSIFSATDVQTLLIEDNKVAAVRAFYVASGIFVDNYLTGAGASLSQALTIDSNTVGNIRAERSSAGGLQAFGIAVGNRVDYTATENQSLTIASNSVYEVSAFATALGIIVGNNVSVNGAALSQSVAILDNSVTQVSADISAVGIGFGDRAYYAGIIRAQSVTIGANLVSRVSAGATAIGIAVVNYDRSNGAVIGQALSITNNTVSEIVGSASAIGILVANEANYRVIISQGLNLSANTISNVSNDALSAVGGIGILLFNSASSATILQDLPISANSVTDVGGDAIRLENHATYSQVSQTGAIAANWVTSNGGIGLSLYNSATGAGSTLFVSLSITGNNLSFDDAGVDSSATAAGGAIVNLHASLNGNTIDDNTTDGIFVAASGAGATETFSLGASDNISFNDSFGVHLVTLGGGVIFFTTDGATITGNTLGNFTGP